jgi:predicted RNase H-like nuclease (RuvC/YqgF family)
MSVGLLAAGCGQELKKENEQLRSQVATLQKDNVELKGQVTSLKADAEALKKQFEELDKEKQGLEAKLKEAEIKASAKPGTRPPLRPKKSS